jgi:hypothetical protein
VRQRGESAPLAGVLDGGEGHVAALVGAGGGAALGEVPVAVGLGGVEVGFGAGDGLLEALGSGGGVLGWRWEARERWPAGGVGAGGFSSGLRRRAGGAGQAVDGLAGLESQRLLIELGGEEEGMRAVGEVAGEALAVGGGDQGVGLVRRG